MAIIKCKMCGGDMALSADKTFGTCEYCGSTMTLPKISDEQRAAAFNRGNHFRRTGEFDKALAVYERIVAENDADAEAHWCCALCRFGIEYVEDPATYEYLPTCHRASFDSFLEDVDYLAAVAHSDGITRRQYQKDAAKIAEVQRGILVTSQNEAPFDVFLCYKETDENGDRTRDSLLAQEIYYQLTEQGRRVFFSRITLEDKAGTQYEPYIFAALNSARVMIAVGTKPEHFNAVWVKNEWSRFLSLMKKDHSKLLLPCYRDMDPYDLPEALSVLQSYDMSKIGFIQDLIRGVNKVLEGNAPRTAPIAPLAQQRQKLLEPFLIVLQRIETVGAGSEQDRKAFTREDDAFAALPFQPDDYIPGFTARWFAARELVQVETARAKAALEAVERERAEEEAARIRAIKDAEEAKLREKREMEAEKIRAKQEAEAARVRAKREAEAERTRAKQERKDSQKRKAEDRAERCAENWNKMGEFAITFVPDLFLAVGIILAVVFAISLFVEGVAIFDVCRIACGQAFHIMGGWWYFCIGIVFFGIYFFIAVKLKKLFGWLCIVKKQKIVIRCVILCIMIGGLILSYAIGVDGSDCILYEDGQYFLFTQSDDGYSLRSSIQREGQTVVTIPSEFRGKPVIEIASWCFYWESDIKHIVVPDGVKRIGALSLVTPTVERLDLPGSLEVIENDAFQNRENLVINYGGSQEMWESIYRRNEVADFFSSKDYYEINYNWDGESK